MKTTTIRICEESDARLMMRDGSFLGFVEAWSNRFPQMKTLEMIRAVKAKYGISLIDSLLLAKEMGLDDMVVFEIGDFTAVRKWHNDFEVFRKDNGVWRRVSGGLGALETEEVFDKPLPYAFNICSEESLEKAGTVEKLAKDLKKKLSIMCCNGRPLAVGDHYILEWDEKGARFDVYSDTLVPMTLQPMEEQIAAFIKEYREKQKIAFGTF